MVDKETIWKIIHSHFEENPQSLVRHHIESYNDFYKTGIFQIFKDNNPISIQSMYDEKIDDFRHQCYLYFGGKKGDRIYFGKPTIVENETSHYMFPNEARLRNMNYEMTIHFDVEVEYIDILEPGEKPYVLTLDMVGGKDRATEIDADYSEEIEEAKEMKAGNFKEKKWKEMEANELAEFDHFDENGIGSVAGGAPKKVERKKRVKSVEVEMTANMAAELREATAKSVNGQNRQIRTMVLEKMYLGKFPIMIQSELCVLHGLPKELRFSMGECRNDVGGYFIIGGKEKVVVPQEKFADNMLYIRNLNSDEYSFSAEIRSVSENVSKPIRTLAVRIMKPTTKYTFNNIVVNIPNVRKPIPLFIVFRALGVLSDKDIITMCLLDLEKYESMMDLFIPSVHDAGAIMTQYTALQYIATFTKYSTTTYVLEVLSDYFLPHIGEINYIQKAYYLGYIVFRLLSVQQGLETPTDRDHFKYKRVELIGSLMYDLFREYYRLQQKSIHLFFEEKLYYNPEMFEENLPGLIKDYSREAFGERIVEIGFRKAFKGNWGSTAHTKRVGIVQDLNRLSFNSALSHLRKTNLPLDASAKVVGPRVLHCSQWGYIDPIDTPDGANIGLHKSLAISTYVSRGYSREPMIQWLREMVAMKLVEECGPALLSAMTKVMVNGYWAGAIKNPVETVKKIRLYRRNGLIPTYTSITFEIKLNTVFIYTDQGRVCRPIFYRDEDDDREGWSFENKAVADRLKAGEFTWSQLVSGFNPKKVENIENQLPRIYELGELYTGITNESSPSQWERFMKEKAIIDYIDPSESENALIASNSAESQNHANKKYTHMEIHESLIMGVMCNQITFPENNPPTRNSFSCGQSKQAVSLYHTNYQVRMDKTAVVLNHGQIPLVKSKYMEYINSEENPYGENAIVAIMCYSGYNMEDSILVNEAALKRGLFSTTYYTSYESHEESSKNANTLVDKRFTNIENQPNVLGTKRGYDYSQLDTYGLIREGTTVNDKMVLIGLTSNNVEKPAVRLDASKTPKKGQMGIVDRAFITEGEEGQRIAKVRIREMRTPNLGDKMASRNGQKGTVGLVIPECDMPFTKDGIRPDLIINPHAIPSRMTIGQLVECITGKACSLYGGFGDCTAFENDGSKIGVFGGALVENGFHSSGNEILYNGMTGEQIQADIFMGPTYYMRLKHMVKDKINYRARGPNTALTRQPVSGRANDGGLRIGEMERDVLIAHGISDFLRESMMYRGDQYYMAICNQTGMLAVYNSSKNLFMSPMADGPIRYTGTVDGKSMNIENITKYGRSFSIVSVPYSFKLLLQELGTANIQMRLITEDNIDQLENMRFSKNIEKLTGINDDEAAMTELISKTKENMLVVKNRGPRALPADLLRDDVEVATNVQPKDEYKKLFAPESPNVYPIELDVDLNEPDSIEFNPFTPPEEESEKTRYYNPESPDFPPPPRSPIPQSERESQNYTGGRGDGEGFRKGEMVHYRGGKKPNRRWRVKDLGVDDFITIETDDMENLEDIGDSIKVVSPFDLYRPNEIVYSDPFQPMLPNQMPPHQNRMMGPFDHPMPTQNFATGVPNVNIKIVNGPDHSVETAADPRSNDGMMPVEEKKISFDTMPIIKLGGVESSSGGILKKEEKGERKSDEPIDFTKLVIKKL